MENLTPKEIVAYLDSYIIGQDKAKRAVAIALRNRWRRMQLPEDIAEDIIPKNILIIGPTGVGKTEIARRIAQLTQSPFIKVEASKYTEVGYVGRDVESMIRDLADLSVNMVKKEHRENVFTQAQEHAEERLLDILIPPTAAPSIGQADDPGDAEKSYRHSREKMRTKLQSGQLDDRMIELDVSENIGGMIEVFSSSGIEEIGMQMKEMIPGLFSPKKKRRKMNVGEARHHLIEEEKDKLIDMDKVTQEGINRAEISGIVFIDEIDKVVGRESGTGPDVSREGVQRDLLPIIEGSAVITKFGPVRTNHILFIGAGAFSISKPADLIPEIQGRFPVKVDVHSLSRQHLRRILIEPKNALTKQYQALMSTEKISILFEDDAIDRIAELAEMVNRESEDIGARRLHTVLEILLEDLSFHASDMQGQQVVITPDYVSRNVTVEAIIKAENIRKKRKPGFR
ncbi:ATP-dependent protease ATPase subunit HslU [bacterium]|nr:ATP-dependent protease ATPase subunit HslU [candidate division CSSED10-310 bacterium]